MSNTFEKLPVQLSDEEVRLRGEELAAKRKEWEAVKAEAKAAAQAAKSQLDELDTDISELARVVRARTEWRDVEVIEQRDFDRGLVETIRTDTGEVVRSRAMTGGERQITLLGAGARREGDEDHSTASSAG